MNREANINVYLSYANVPLVESNYNEVDALVFAQLTYLPFEKILTGCEIKSISIPEYAALIMRQPDFQIMYSSDEQLFIKELVHCKRYMRCIMHDMKAMNTTDSQWAAITVDMGFSGVSIIAMRGTDGTTVGWAENLRTAYQVIGTGAQLESFRYVKNSKSKKIYLTGHSKGGSNICSAYIMSNPHVRDKIFRIDNFDGPGVNPEFAAHYADGYKELKDKLSNFYPKDSVIGQLLQDNSGKHYYVKTQVRDDYAHRPILGQHDPFASVVRGNEFLKVSQTDKSKGINDVVDDLMAKTTNIQRYHLVQCMHRIGIPALISGENGRGITEIAHMVCGLIQSTPEEKRIVFEVICSFIKCLINRATEWIAQQGWKGYNKRNAAKAYTQQFTN